MNVEDLIQHYRLLDVSYGSLETSERIRHELLALKYEQIKARKGSLLDRSIVALLTVVAGLPALYSLIPDNIGKLKTFSISAFAILALAYWIIGLLQWWKSSDEEKELDSILNTSPPYLTEDNPAFLQMQVSTLLTRRRLIKEILSKEELEEPVRKRFVVAGEYWNKRVDKAKRQVESLHKTGKMNPERFQEIQDWFQRELEEG